MTTRRGQHRQARTRRRSSSRGAGADAGFTVIELLVVMFIITVLIALIVGVGIWIRSYVREKNTRSTQETLRTALQAYFDVYETYPPDWNPKTERAEDLGKGDEYDHSGYSLFQYLAGRHDNGAELTDLTEEEAVRAAIKVLKGLAREAWPADGPAFKDGWGQNMRYDLDRGPGGVPAVISPGPDGKFDTNEDNIY